MRWGRRKRLAMEVAAMASGRDDGAQDETSPPPPHFQSRGNPGGGSGHTEHGEADQPKGEKEDADQIEFEIAPGLAPRSTEAEGADEEDERQIQRDLGCRE